MLKTAAKNIKNRCGKKMHLKYLKIRGSQAGSIRGRKIQRIKASTFILIDWGAIDAQLTFFRCSMTTDHHSSQTMHFSLCWNGHDVAGRDKNDVLHPLDIHEGFLLMYQSISTLIETDWHSEDFIIDGLAERPLACYYRFEDNYCSWKVFGSGCSIKLTGIFWGAFH